MAEQQQRGLRRPLEIVEDQEHRLVGGRRRQPGGHRVEQPVTLSLRVGTERGREVRHPLTQFGDEPCQLTSVPAETLLERLGRRVIDEVAQRLHERLVGHAQVLVAAAGQHDAALIVDPDGNLGGQAGLAHSRLPGQEGDPPLARRRFLPQLRQPLQFGVAADEDPPDVGEQRRHRDRRTAAAAPSPPGAPSPDDRGPSTPEGRPDT